MAVPGILLTLEGLEQVVGNGQEINFMGMKTTDSQTDIINRVIDTLKQYKKEAEATEAKILEVFGPEIQTAEDLQAAFLRFQNETGLIKLTGPSLRQTVLEQYEMSVKYNNQEFYNWVQTEFLPSLTKDIGEDVMKSKEFNIIMSERIVNALSNGPEDKYILTGHRIGDRATTGQLYKESEGIGRVVLSKLSKNRMTRLEDKYKTETGKEAKVAKTDVKFELDSPPPDGLLGIRGRINYYAATSGGKKKTAITNEDRERLKKILVSEIQNIISKEYPEDMTSVISQLLNEQGDQVIDSFFVGGNINDVTGILGELSAIIALKKLIPGANVHDIIWTAKEQKDGKQLSLDFIIKGINGMNIGVQVKNTTKNLYNLEEQIDKFKIGFVDTKIKLTFKRIGEKYPELQEGSKNQKYMKLVYISSSFNVPYKYKIKDDGSYEYGTEGEKFPNYYRFLYVQKQIFNLKDKLDQILKAIAPDLLFMSTGDDFQNTLANISNEFADIVSGNNLYIIGGKPIFASEILDSIINNLSLIQIEIKNNEVNTESNAKLIKEGILEKGDNFTGGTIIDYLNKFGTNGVDWQKIRRATKEQNFQFTSSLLVNG